MEETVQEIIQDVEDEIPMTSKKKRKLKVGTSNGNGTVNMPARREYVAVAKNSLDGSGSSKVKIAVPKANNRPAARVMAQAPAAYAFDKIKETGMSTEMLDPDGDDDVEFDGTGFGNEDDSSETAKLWGSVMTDLRKVLRQTNELKGQHELIKAVVASVGPRLRGLCEQFSKTQIALWRTMKATKTTCDFVSLMRPTVTGLLSTLSISSSLKKGDIDVIFASVLQSRDRETKGVKADPESTIYASREILRPWAQGIDIDHETVGALTESSDLAVLGSAALNADGTQQPSLPSITAAEFFGDDPATRSRRTEV